MGFTFIRTLRNAVAIIRTRYFSTRAEAALAAKYRAQNRLHQSKADAPLVSMQCVEDPFYFCLFGEIVTALRSYGPVRTDQYVLRSFRTGISQSAGNFLQSLLYSNPLSDWKWTRLYGAFCDHVAYHSTCLVSPPESIRLVYNAAKIWRGLQTADDLAVLSVRGIEIGDLVLDTYLRFKPAVTVDIKDVYLLLVIRQALKNLMLAERYFRTKQPSVYLTSYTSYVQHGIPTRVAASLGIRTLAFGNYQEVATEITAGNRSHAKPGQDYFRDFLRLSDQDEKSEMARRELSSRISGKIDPTTSYMKQSAYEIKSTNVPDVAGAAIIFLHDFFDSPHCYRWMIFNDFWEWACNTIETLEDADLPFFVKPHPNQVVASAVHIERLKQKHPALRMIPPEITNKQLADAGMRCAITVHGTVASEAAFLGVPSISCGDNPHISFEFTRTARNRSEYKNFLRDFPNYRPAADLLRTQACAFYYMHNRNLAPETAALRDKLVAIRTRMIDLYPPKASNIEEISEAYRTLSQMPGFRDFAVSLYRQITFQQTTSAQGKSQGSTECSQMPQY